MTDEPRIATSPGREGETLALPTCRRPGHDREDGFTIIEVMIAILIMIVGVLGTLIMIEGGLASTSRTTAREQGTNLARDLVERSRQLSYANTTMALAPANLRAALPSSDAATALTGTAADTFNVTRRNTTYAVKIFSCSIDDPTDGAGVGDNTYCAATTGTSGPGTTAPGAAAAVNVLGIAVTAGGSLLQTVCNAVGTDTTILNTLTTAVSTVAPLSACSSTASGTLAYDRQADDMRRVSVTVTWTKDGRSGRLVQTTLLTNPRQT